jgi:hypothetical protein
MTSRIVAVVAVAILTALSGCRKQDPADRAVKDYDPETAPPPSVVSVSLNMDLLGDQAEISRRYARESGTSASAAPAHAATPVEQVRQLLTTVKQETAAGDATAALKLYSSEDRPLIQSIIDSTEELKQAQADLKAKVSAKLTMELPMSVEALLNTDQSDAVVDPLGKENVDEMTVEQVGGNVNVTGSSGAAVTFAPAGGDHAIELTDDAKAAIAFLGRLVPAQAQFAQQLAAGIDDGTVTAANFDRQANAIASRTVAPVMASRAGMPADGAAPGASATPAAPAAGRGGSAEEDRPSPLSPAGITRGIRNIINPAGSGDEGD